MDILIYLAYSVGFLVGAVLCWIICSLLILGIMRFNAWSARVSRNISRNARRIS